MCNYVELQSLAIAPSAVLCKVRFSCKKPYKAVVPSPVNSSSAAHNHCYLHLYRQSIDAGLSAFGGWVLLQRKSKQMLITMNDTRHLKGSTKLYVRKSHFFIQKCRWRNNLVLPAWILWAKICSQTKNRFGFSDFTKFSLNMIGGLWLIDLWLLS